MMALPHVSRWSSVLKNAWHAFFRGGETKRSWSEGEVIVSSSQPLLEEARLIYAITETHTMYD